MTQQTILQEAEARGARAEKKHVRIINDHGNVDRESVTISHPDQEEVLWFANGKQPATIVFSSKDGSPFQESVFHVPPNGSAGSGPARPDAKRKYPYKYTVKGPAGFNDPVVIVDP